MATKRDFELGLQVTTLGSESVKKLKDEVDALAKSGGDAAPEFQQLSNELAELGSKAAALEVFDALARDVQALSLAQGAATRNANELSVELADLTAKTNAQRTAEQASLSSLKESREALSLKRDELARLKAETVASGNSDDAYKKKVLDLTLAIIDNRAEVRQRVEDYRQAKAATTAAVTEEAKLEKAFNDTTRQARDSTTALNEREAAIRDSLNALQALGVETKDLAASEIELLQALSQSEQALRELAQAQEYAKDVAAAAAVEAQQQAEIQKRAARDYAAFWEQALGQREQAEKDALEAQKAAAVESERTAQTLKNALGTVGVKAAADLEREIQNVKDSLLLLKNSGTLTGAELDRATDVANRRIKELERNVREATGQLTLMDRTAAAFKSTFGQTAGGFVAAEIFQKLAEYVRQLGTAFISANVNLEKFRLALNTVYKDSNLAASQLNFLRNTAQLAGLSVSDIGQSFIKFSASMQAANIPLGQTNALFAAVTRAAGVLGLSSDEARRAIDALGQMGAKGVVSMEELRQQLGDALPGALSLAAQGFGISEAELIKLVETGKLATRDFVPAFTKGLQGLQGEVNTLSAAFNRARDAITLTFQNIGDAGAVDALKAAFSFLAFAVGSVVLPLTAFLELVFGLTRAAGVLVGALFTLTNPLDALRGILDSAADRQTRLTEAFDRAIGLSKASADATINQSNEVVKLNLAYAQAESQLEKNTKASKLQADTAKEQGDAAIQLAQAFSDQQEQLDVAAKAAVTYAASMATLAEDERREVEVLESKLAQRKALFEQERADLQLQGLRGTALEKALADRAKELEQLAQEITLKDEATKKTEAKAAAAKVAAEAARLEAEVNKDNSARLGELSKAYEAARIEVERLTLANADSAIKSKELAAAELELDKATRLLSDAMTDAISIMEATQKSKQADFAITQAKLKLDLESYKSLEATARALGNESLARYALIEQKKIQIKIIEASTKASIAEAQGSILVAKAKLDELKISEPNNKVKQIELETIIKVAEARIIEAKARGQATEALEREINALRNGTNAKNQNKDASDKTANSVNKEADVRFKNADAIERENDAIAAQNGLRKIGNDYIDQNNFVTDKTGQRLTMDIQNRNSVYNRAKGAGLSASKAEEIAQQFIGENGQYRGYSQNEPWEIALNRVIGEAVRAQDLAAERGTGNNTNPFGAPAPTPAPAPATGSQPVNIVINGVSSSVNVSSPSDATKLRGIIEQLATAKGTSV